MLKFRHVTLDRHVDTNDLIKLTQHFAYEEGTCLLYSGSSYETAQCSYLFLFPFDIINIQGGLQQRCRLNGATLMVNEDNPWEAMKILGHDIGKGSGPFPEWSGFFGYEMGAYSDEDVVTPHHLAVTPEAYWQRCAITLMLDHKTGKVIIQLAEGIGESLDEQNRQWFLYLSTKEGWDELLDTDFEQSRESANINSKLDLGTISDTLESYVEKIGRAKEFIKSGDVYQINLSQQWEFLGERDPFELFKQLALLNPAPFSAYLFKKEFSIISSSPERFLQKRGENLEARPIKGTAPRGKTTAEDTELKNELLSSEKERAELMMITDLMRNDLGKISAIGSVEVPLLCGCEAYQNVFHLYSIVKSRVLPSYSPLDIVRSCFPGGSITGCPKLRAMEVIEELEKRPRGIYTGSMGYFSHNGDFDFNIAIRTLLLADKKIIVQLGGAIVIDSDPKKEYEETHHKGSSIFEILNSSTINIIPVIQ
ncbi:MAG TPA: aminodeoxychorismate synthase component I [Parachlamydiaceae bacterium]|nr:aminodeoxychorismate synthase component I [Parachlamydiaceae bacterium]